MFNSYRKKHPGIYWSAISLAILLPSVSIALGWLVKDGYSITVISDLSAPLYNIFATIALLLGALSSRKISKRLALGWGILALAQLSFTLGDILWAVIELGLKSSPFPSIADGPYLLYYPLFFIGIILLTSKRYSPTEWIKNTLDISIIMATAILGFWIFLIGPIIYTGSSLSFLEKFLTIAYPVGDLIQFFALLVIIFYTSAEVIILPGWILASSLVVAIVSDSVFSYQSLSGTYISGGVLDYGWILASILIVFAGLSQAIAAQSSQKDVLLTTRNFVIPEKFSQALTYLPYVNVIAAYYLLSSYYNSELPMNSDALFTGVGCIIGFVIFRQIIALNENRHFLATLREALEQEKLQASELDKTNRNLHQEVIERKRVEEQLAHDALHDGLTGLANQVLFMDRLGHAVEIAKRELNFHYSVLSLDLDNFKSINDALGHSTGDLVLIEIGQRINKCIRSIDTEARFGGDEFFILLENTAEKNSAVSVANRILTDLQHPFLYKDKEVLVTCSIGIVQGIAEYNHSEDILRDVDIAMYRAKKTGKSRFAVFNLDMRMSTLSRIEIEGDLRRALANQEFLLHYQPIYSLEQNLIVELEALIRWRHPLRGLLMPSEFIKIAEESGLIIQIGDWVLQEACAQMKKWHIEHPELEHLSVNVNISGKQITQKDFATRVKEALQTTGLNPRRLKLEITENAFIESQALANELIADLQKIGVEFMIDDFGTGYSSLGYLQNFSVNTIKIDKTFVDEIVESKKVYEIIKTIILMARQMGIDTIAEGIENIEQLQKLRSLMCKYGQGYYLAKPMDAELVKKRILEKQDAHPGEIASINQGEQQAGEGVNGWDW